MKKYAYIKTLMLIPAFLITTKKWEQPKCPKPERLTKHELNHGMECYSAIKRNVVLQDILLS